MVIYLPGRRTNGRMHGHTRLSVSLPIIDVQSYHLIISTKACK